MDRGNRVISRCLGINSIALLYSPRGGDEPQVLEVCDFISELQTNQGEFFSDPRST